MTLPEPDDEAVEAFIDDFRDATGYDGDVGVFAFGDSAEMAEGLALLVRFGPKRATAGPSDPEERLEVGSHDVVIGGDGQPVAILRTDEVRTLPYREADPAFAWDEGEGDRTLTWWRDAHDRFLARHVDPLPQDLGDIEVDLERFSVVWPQLPEPKPLLERDGIVVRPVRPEERDWVRTATGEATSDDGWSTDRCPALLARHDGRTAGVLVFVPKPKPGRSEVVATAYLEEADGVEAALRDALNGLAREHKWAPPAF